MLTLEELKNDANFFPFEIPGLVWKWINDHPTQTNAYCSYVHILGDELIVRTFAFRHGKKKEHYQTFVTEVERKTVSQEWAARKNIYFTQMGGYHPVYMPKSCGYSTYYGYSYYYFSEEDFDRWTHDRPMNLYTELINPERVFELDKYKYCGYSGQQDLIEYLRLYEQDPNVEYFGKLGIRAKKSLIKKVQKDKGFARYLKENTQKANIYGPQVTIYAYDHHMSISEADKFLTEKRHAERTTVDFWNIKESGVDRMKICRYINENHIGRGLYKDYFEAISRLGYDLTDTKNLFPKDFMRMHDLRCDEWGSKKAKLKEKEKKSFNRKFKEAAAVFKGAEIVGDKYAVVIPNKVSDLEHEGTKLHHCVGRMGYDKKMVEGKCLIAFIRKVEDVETPYVTVEYLTKEKKLAQVYGDHDSKPDDDVRAFVNEWAKKLTKDLKRREKENALQKAAN